MRFCPYCQGWGIWLWMFRPVQCPWIFRDLRLLLSFDFVQPFLLPVFLRCCVFLWNKCCPIKRFRACSYLLGSFGWLDLSSIDERREGHAWCNTAVLLPLLRYLLSVKLYEAGIRLFCIFMQIASWPASNPTQCAKQISAGTSWSNSISETSEQENHPISQSWKRFDQTRSAKGMLEILAFHDKVQCAGSNFSAIFHKSGKQDLALPPIKPQLWIFCSRSNLRSDLKWILLWFISQRDRFNAYAGYKMVQIYTSKFKHNLAGRWPER